ncbi:MAG: nuclear transport factor 2 family protein [Alphaproteobacteria bacterium]
MTAVWNGTDRTRIGLALVAAFVLSMLVASAPARAASSDGDRAAVLSVAERLFEAINTQDPALWNSLVLKDATIARTQPDPAGGFRIDRMVAADMAARLKPGPEPYRERFTAEPTVLIRGAIAVVWGDYDFWIGDTFSHCWVDAIDLLKIDGRWMVSNLMWTMEREGCPTAPPAR